MKIETNCKKVSVNPLTPNYKEVVLKHGPKIQSTAEEIKKYNRFK